MAPGADPFRPADALFFAEDPGAANFLQGLPQALRDRGWSALLIARGPAVEYLSQREIAFTPYPEEREPSDLLASLRSRLLVAGTAEDPDTPGLGLLDAARAAGTVSVGAVDGFCNAPLRFKGRSAAPLAHPPDWILAADEPTRRAFLELGADPVRVVEFGHPAFERASAEKFRLDRGDRNALRAKLFPQAPEGSTVMVFAAEISTGLHPIQYRRAPEYTIAGSGRSDGRTQIVLDEVLDALRDIPRKPYLVLRLHPKNILEEFAEYRCRFDAISSGGSPHDLIYAADLVVGMTSVIMAEAAHMGTPTLAVVPRPAERDWLPAIAAGLVPCAQTREQIRQGLSALLSDAPVRSGSAGGPREGGNPGSAGATERIAGFLHGLISGGQDALALTRPQ